MIAIITMKMTWGSEQFVTIFKRITVLLTSFNTMWSILQVQWRGDNSKRKKFYFKCWRWQSFQQIVGCQSFYVGLLEWSTATWYNIHVMYFMHLYQQKCIPSWKKWKTSSNTEINKVQKFKSGVKYLAWWHTKLGAKSFKFMQSRASNLIWSHKYKGTPVRVLFPLW